MPEEEASMSLKISI